mmetsp:Transcript_9045/g.22821  ORF Transcript_9045/g.22821 Transcript_9045/m.22821 type:complete len:252 (+) Transcript_9045:28-783(+)
MVACRGHGPRFGCPLGSNAGRGRGRRLPACGSHPSAGGTYLGSRPLGLAGAAGGALTLRAAGPLVSGELPEGPGSDRRRSLLGLPRLGVPAPPGGLVEGPRLSHRAGADAVACSRRYPGDDDVRVSSCDPPLATGNAHAARLSDAERSGHQAGRARSEEPDAGRPMGSQGPHRRRLRGGLRAPPAWLDGGLPLCGSSRRLPDRRRCRRRRGLPPGGPAADARLAKGVELRTRRDWGDARQVGRKDGGVGNP